MQEKFPINLTEEQLESLRQEFIINLRRGYVKVIIDNKTQYQLVANLPDKNGMTPLHHICFRGYVDRLCILFDNFNITTINACESNMGLTALHISANRDYPDIVQMLLRKGADATIESKFQQKPSDLTTLLPLKDLLVTFENPASKLPSTNIDYPLAYFYSSFSIGSS